MREHMSRLHLTAQATGYSSAPWAAGLAFTSATCK